MLDFKVGDEVLVLRTAQSGENGWAAEWRREMDYFVGKVWKVTDVNIIGVVLENSWNFPGFVLEKAKPIFTAVKEFHGYPVTYTNDIVKIGCKEFTRDYVQKLLNKFNDDIQEIKIHGVTVTQGEVSNILEGFTAAKQLKYKAGDEILIKVTVIEENEIFVRIKFSSGYEYVHYKERLDVIAIIE